ncbi:MAG: hypothetical protein ABR562_03565 [Thermoplasmatota archaeon]
MGIQAFLASRQLATVGGWFFVALGAFYLVFGAWGLRIWATGKTDWIFLSSLHSLEARSSRRWGGSH